VGTYSAVFTLQDEIAGDARIVVDLGSTAGALGEVSVNGRAPRGFDTSRPVVDITDDVTSGANELMVRVASSLNNRLIARGYYADMMDIMGALVGMPGARHQVTVRDHGLLGPVRLLMQ
jgi:hypothetical protein